MKKLILILSVLCVSVFGQTNIGTITIHNALGWDANTETNIAGYRIYVGEVSETNLNAFQRVGEVSTNLWRGDSTKNLNGEKKVYVTAFNDLGLESEPSEVFLLTFRAGVPIPPTNFQLFTVVQAAATNALPPLP